MGRIAVLLLLAAGAVAAVLVRGPTPDTGTASSHREAPMTSQDPVADNVDTYAFVSPDRPDTVTIIATYIPLEEPAGGPTFYRFGDDVVYEIRVVNDGDGVDDVRYRFNFRTRIRNPNTFLYNTGPINTLRDSDWNLRQFYNVRRIKWTSKGRKIDRLGRNIPTPPVNIGPRSTPQYESLMGAAVTKLRGGVKVFAGQVDDPFFVDLGSVFDLGGLRPLNPAHVIPLGAAKGVDGVGGFNTHAIAIQVPIKHLTRNGRMPTGADDKNAVLGVYANASRHRVQIMRDGGDRLGRGSKVQVSRLANPLVNEAIIPLGKKDRWNATTPRKDKRFRRHFVNPELAVLEKALYPVLGNVPTRGRGDIAAIFLTGVPGLNFTGPTNADLIRLNTAIPPSGPVGTGDRLGVLGGDLAGWPNGRRLEDDVTDIALRAVACGYGTVAGPLIESLGFCNGDANRSPNNTIGDGVNANDRPFKSTFPYLGTPHQGYQHVHHKPVGGR